jgi:hypothetical protein
MDFIEQWLGWSPDKGDGNFEVIVIFAVVISILWLLRRRYIRDVSHDVAGATSRLNISSPLAPWPTTRTAAGRARAAEVAGVCASGAGPARCRAEP